MRKGIQKSPKSQCSITASGSLVTMKPCSQHMSLILWHDVLDCTVCTVVHVQADLETMVSLMPSRQLTVNGCDLSPGWGMVDTTVYACNN